MGRKREASAVVALIVVGFRRLCRSSRPLCIGALPLCLAHLASSPAEPVHPPPLPAASSAQAPAPQPPSTAAIPEISRSTGRAIGALESPSASPASLETIRRAADLLANVDTALGVPRSPYGQLIYDVAIRHAVNPHLVAAMIHVESAFNPRAVSRKGACGLMQLLPATARRFGLRKRKDLFDPKKNLQAGVLYLKWLTQRFGGDVEKILAAYNAGEGAVERFGGIPPYRETQQYVDKIFGLLGFTPEPPSAGVGTSGVVAAGGR